MKKIRRFIQALLFANFMVSLHDGMRVENLAVVLVNGVIVLMIIAAEKKD